MYYHALHIIILCIDLSLLCLTVTNITNLSLQFGGGLERNFTEAFQLFFKLAQQGHPGGQQVMCVLSMQSSLLSFFPFSD